MWFCGATIMPQKTRQRHDMWHHKTTCRKKGYADYALMNRLEPVDVNATRIWIAIIVLLQKRGQIQLVQ